MDKSSNSLLLYCIYQMMARHAKTLSLKDIYKQTDRMAKKYHFFTTNIGKVAKSKIPQGCELLHGGGFSAASAGITFTLCKNADQYCLNISALENVFNHQDIDLFMERFLNYLK